MKKKICNYLKYSWELRKEVEELPEGELKQAIKDWQTRQLVASGAMSISGIMYRNNLQHMLENTNKDGIVSEIQNKCAIAPKEYGQLLLKHGQEFKDTFGVPLADYMNLITGFDVVKFDKKIVEPADGISTSEAIRVRWGEMAVELVTRLF